MKKYAVQRIVSAFGAFVVSAAAAEAYWRMDSSSSFSVTAFFLANIIVTAALVLLSVCSNRIWDAIVVSLAPLASRLRQPCEFTFQRIAPALWAVGICSYILIQVKILPEQMSPEKDDQADYLRAAAEVQKSDGVPGLVSRLYSGEFKEANRHPLFIGLLSLSPDFHHGKLISATVGLLTLCVTSFWIRHEFGSAVSGIFCILLATNYAFCYACVLVTCESLVMLLTSLAWLTAIKVSKHPTTSKALLLGALLGACYLTKATGLLLLGATLASMIASGLSRTMGSEPQVKRQSRIKLVQMLVSLSIGFAVIASPLLVRNVKRFDQVFYNVNSCLLFMDSATDIEALPHRPTTLELAREYIRTHTIGDMVLREWTGLAWETFIFVRSLGPAPLDDSRAAIGIAMLALAAIGAWGLRHAGVAVYLAWLFPVLVTFAWYIPIAAGERFVLPLLIPTLVYCARGLVQLAHTKPALPAKRLAVACVCWSVVWTIATHLMTELAHGS